MSLDKAKAIALRFIKAFVSGFVTAAGLITASNVHNLTDLHLALATLSIAGTVGGINGVLMAAEKWYNWKEIQ